MEIKEFWPDWLKDAVSAYFEDDDKPRRKQRDRLETINDIYYLNQLTPEDTPLIDKCYQAMADVYEGKKNPYLTRDQWEKYAIGYPLKAGERDPLPHITTLLTEIEPFKSVRLKYPALYKTLIIWMWG
jgi:hypothetical protein